MPERDKRVAFSFRARLVIVMTVLLLGSFAMVQYLNQSAQQEVREALDRQRVVVGETFFDHANDINKATTFALETFKTTEYIDELLRQPEYQNAINRNRIRHILVVEPSGEIKDSTEPELRHKFVKVPGSEGGAPRAGVERGDPVAAIDPSDDDDECDTYWTHVETKRVDTNSKEVSWIAIVASNRDVNRTIEESQHEVASVMESTALAQSRLTLVIYGLAVALAIFLGYRFTRPLNLLSNAAERVARGDLDFTVNITRRDEMGQLAHTFNGMIEGLKAKAVLEERLNNAERAAVIGRLTSAIAHEIRNPLNFINLSIDHVRSKYPPAEPRERERFDGLLGTIKEEAARLNRLVTDVLNFGRPASLNVRTVNLVRIADEVIALVRTKADEQGVEIETRVPAGPVEIEGDAEKLKSCFANIVINALQAMPDGGRLVVAVECDPQNCHLRFSDTGAGIPEEALDRVFEPYYSTKDTGTGLGLAVTKKIVEEHGGRIRVESAPGEGTTFEVDLPRERAAAGGRERMSLAGMKP
jgi:signal transduction histidine kinase